ncbi:MAG: DUF371 domain-containing protein [Candidatus Heimdallarchaeota archaeon]|nr:DUF371 domain-containing protein [Candidatus Heimdallarchaeota archaeon]
MTVFNFHCNGHKNIRSQHNSTIEFTTASDLSIGGDCILGVKSSCNLLNLPQELKEKMRINGNAITVILEVDNRQEIIVGYGNSELSFSDEEAIIIRKSSFVCQRTLMINSDKSAADISRKIVNSLRDPNNILYVTIHVD